MAGGSADAAAALLACAALWDLDRTVLPDIAAELGSDVAFPLLGGTALGTGRGEVLRPVPCGAQLHWAFAMAGFGISAGAAYRGFDRLRTVGDAPVTPARPHTLLAALERGDLAGIAANLHNDLEPAALSLRPSLQAVLDRGRTAGALAGIVSGSGPTCAFLCDSAARASDVAEALGDVCRATRVATGPVAGPVVEVF
jgi:4-diphosphocytidyl-2-C-methyl-D-erythritol kinase